MQLARFRLRTLMIVVAVVGLLLGGGLTLRRRSAQFRVLAQHHHALAGFATMTYADGSSTEFRLTPEGYQAKQDWHLVLRDKYKCAARYPWLPVPADPPEPK